MPNCWHFVQVPKEFDEIYMKISSLLPKQCTFITDCDSSSKSQLLPCEMKFEACDRDKLKRDILSLELGKVSELTCTHGRTPLKVNSWMTEALDSCYLHVGKHAKFPELLENARESELDTLREWSFTALNRESDELLRLTFRIFEDFGLLKEFGISEERFKLFLLAVECNYFDNPYHNFYHVVDVLQCCYYLLKKAADGRLPGLLGNIHLFALLIGCLCHDLGHPSFGNNFLKDSTHPLAILFNDSSVLENYHAMILFSILRCPLYNWSTGCNEGFGGGKEFRKCVLGCILGTDMSNHFDFIKQFNEQFPKLDGHVTELTSSQRIQLATALIKCSDISNVLRPFPIARTWGLVLLQEFFLQGDYEKLLGLPLGPLNDRCTLKTGPAQHQFLTVVAAPLYRAVAAKIDGLDCFELWITENAENWLNYQE